MPGQLHRDPLGDAGPHEIPHGGASKIVRDLRTPAATRALRHALMYPPSVIRCPAFFPFV